MDDICYTRLAVVVIGVVTLFFCAGDRQAKLAFSYSKILAMEDVLSENFDIKHVRQRHICHPLCLVVRYLFSSGAMCVYYMSLV